MKDGWVILVEERSIGQIRKAESKAHKLEEEGTSRSLSAPSPSIYEPLQRKVTVKTGHCKCGGTKEVKAAGEETNFSYFISN